MGGQCLLEILGVLQVLRKDGFLGVNSHMLSENLDCTRDQRLFHFYVGMTGEPESYYRFGDLRIGLGHPRQGRGGV